MTKECPALSYLSKLGTKLSRDIAEKHEDGEFLPEVTAKNPHLHKRKNELLHLYCDLLIEIGDAIRQYKSKQQIKDKIKILARNLKNSQNLEHKLVFDSFLIDLGESH